MTKTGIIEVRLGETCIVCEHVKLEGIHLFDSFICEECETDVINSETTDENYNFYVKQLKKLISVK